MSRDVCCPMYSRRPPSDCSACCSSPGFLGRTCHLLVQPTDRSHADTLVQLSKPSRLPPRRRRPASPRRLPQTHPSSALVPRSRAPPRGQLSAFPWVLEQPSPPHQLSRQPAGQLLHPLPLPPRGSLLPRQRPREVFCLVPLAAPLPLQQPLHRCLHLPAPPLQAGGRPS